MRLLFILLFIPSICFGQIVKPSCQPNGTNCPGSVVGNTVINGGNNQVLFTGATALLTVGNLYFDGNNLDVGGSNFGATLEVGNGSGSGAGGNTLQVDTVDGVGLTVVGGSDSVNSYLNQLDSGNGRIGVNNQSPQYAIDVQDNGNTGCDIGDSEQGCYIDNSDNGTFSNLTISGGDILMGSDYYGQIDFPTANGPVYFGTFGYGPGAATAGFSITSNVVFAFSALAPRSGWAGGYQWLGNEPQAIMDLWPVESAIPAISIASVGYITSGNVIQICNELYSGCVYKTDYLGNTTAKSFITTTGTSTQVVLGTGALGTYYSSPLTTLGDTLYENSTPAAAKLAGNITTTKKFLTQTGTGSISAVPGWNTIVAGDVPILNQNTTGNAATVTTNANLTGPIISSGNATSISSQTGTGSQFVVSNTPTITTPTFSGNSRISSGVFLRTQGSVPTIASNGCGTTTQGTVASGSTDEAFAITAGTISLGSVLTCTMTFGQSHTSPPISCACQDGTTPLALSATQTNTTITCTALATLSGATVTGTCSWTAP